MKQEQPNFLVWFFSNWVNSIIMIFFVFSSYLSGIYTYNFNGNVYEGFNFFVFFITLFSYFVGLFFVKGMIYYFIKKNKKEVKENGKKTKSSSKKNSSRNRT